MSYLDHDGYRSRSNLPAVFVDEVEQVSPGWLDTLLDDVSAQVNARLSKRYAVPFTAPYPRAILRWVAVIADPVVMRKRGIDQTDQQYIDIRDAAAEAWKEIKEAADSENGLVELPKRADTSDTGVTKGGPFGYSESSAYVWRDVAGARAREEDRNGFGTGDV